MLRGSANGALFLVLAAALAVSGCCLSHPGAMPPDSSERSDAADLEGGADARSPGECASHADCDAKSLLCLSGATAEICWLCGVDNRPCSCVPPPQGSRYRAACGTDADCAALGGCGTSCDDCPPCPPCIHGWCAYPVGAVPPCLCSGCG